MLSGFSFLGSALSLVLFTRLAQRSLIKARMPTKAFRVIVTNCDNAGHAQRLCGLLRGSFPHRNVNPEHTSCVGMVQADSEAEIREALSLELRKAKLVCGEVSYLSENGTMSVVPPDFMQFAPPGGQ